MCARTVFREKQYHPRSMIPVSSAKKLEGTASWGEKGGLQRAFAKSENEAYWREKAGFDVELDHPVDSFAEKDRRTKELVSKKVEGVVIYLLGNRKTGEAVMLTKAADAQEKEFFGHDRVPVTGPRRFGKADTFSADTEDM